MNYQRYTSVFDGINYINYYNTQNFDNKKTCHVFNRFKSILTTYSLSKAIETITNLPLFYHFVGTKKKKRHYTPTIAVISNTFFTLPLIRL